MPPQAGSTAMEITTHETPLQDQAKKMDLEIAKKIASYAGMTLRDRHLNLSDDVWQASNDINDTTRLLDTASMRKILIEQLNTHLEAQKELLLQADSQHVLVQWIMDFQDKWEHEIAKKSQSRFDISFKILTVMEEALIAVDSILQEHDLSEQQVLHALGNRIINLQAHTYNNHNTYVRLMYRNEILGPHMCRVAGKLLQKQLVCNRSGAYSSTKQRNDVTQERDEAMMQLRRFLSLDGDKHELEFRAWLQSDFDNSYLLNHCIE